MKYLIPILGIFIFWGCKKADPVYPFKQESIVNEGLTFEEDSFFASLPAIIPKPSQIDLGNGETVQSFLIRTNPNSLSTWGQRTKSNQRIQGDEKFYNFLTDLTSEGNSMINNQTLHRKEDPVTEFDNDTKTNITYEQPEQIGYGYVYNGAIDLTKRKRAGNCKLKLFGIDCSGMVTLMLDRAGVNFHNIKYPAATLSTEEVLNGALITSTTLKDFNYEYEDEPPSFLNQCSTGDIIYFKHKGETAAFHLGIIVRILGAVNTLYIYQSNGTNLSDPQNRGCETYSNQDKRGPRCVPVQEIINWKNVASFGILHLVPKKPIDVSLIVHDWKFRSELTGITVGHQAIPIYGYVNSVNADNLTLKFDANNNFSLADKDPSDSCSGKFIMFNNGNSIRFIGCEIYDRDPITASIVELVQTRLTLSFQVTGTGFVQNSTLFFGK